MPVLIYLHIPKTGGNTIQNIILKQKKYNKIVHLNPPTPAEFIRALENEGISVIEKISYKKLSDIDLAKVIATDKSEGTNIIMGHIGYGIHNNMKSDFRYFTMLRNPVDFTLSLYHDLFRSFDNFERNLVSKFNGISDFANHIKNLQCFILSGSKNYREFKSLNENTCPLVKKNISGHFDSVGIMEKFPESVLLFRKQFGWKNVFHNRTNKARKESYINIEKYRKDKALIREIELANNFDMEIYEYCLSKFVARLREENITERQIGIFNFKNKIYNRFIK